MLTAAAAIFAGGSRLARRTETERVKRDREPLRQFAEAMQGELNRLERLYESHLSRLSRKTPTDDAIRIRMACNWLVGVKQVSVLSTQTDHPREPLHAKIESGSRGGNLRPSFYGEKPPRGLRESLVMLADDIRHAETLEFGWVDHPGSAPVFWYRPTAELCVAVLVSREDVAKSMNRWMRAWVAQHFVPNETGKGGDKIVGPDHAPLAVVGAAAETADRHPDAVIAMNQRFGAWQLLSWDGMRTMEFSHLPSLAGSAALATLIALLGVGIFVQQRRALKTAAQQVSFINRVSHELRAPLTNILLNVDLAIDHLNESAGESARRLAVVQGEGGRLSRLIDNVLTFSRREQGRLTLHPRPAIPSAVIQSVLQQFSEALERCSIQVQTTGALTKPCLFDPDAFSQILTNLVSNVEKYAGDGGHLGIDARLEDAWLKVTVTDRGPGIPEKEVEKIFRPFFRLHRETSEGATGAGLGLSIARDLASRMGGSLRLRASATGAVFELRLPFRTVADHTEKPA